MRALLLPIKDLSQAKKRLTDVLSPEERYCLAQAMLSDTVRAVRGIRNAERIFVVTSYPPAMHFAEENGWHVIHEREQISESHSVDYASKHCEQLGVAALLRLPLDLPLIRAADIDELLAADFYSPSLVIVPSRDGTGTNAMLRTPPTLFPSHFGTGSFTKHLAEARTLNAQVTVQRNPRVEMDVDDESDLRALLTHDLNGTETGKWLYGSGVAARFHTTVQAGAAAAG